MRHGGERCLAPKLINHAKIRHKVQLVGIFGGWRVIFHFISLLEGVS